MNQRLQQFLLAENISQSTFADIIEVSRATVSHVLSGRNKPGYDFFLSIAAHFPALNLEWLICGKGKMYKTPAKDTNPEIPAALPLSIPTTDTTDDDLLFPAAPAEQPPLPPVQTAPQEEIPSPSTPPEPNIASTEADYSAQATEPQRVISKIIVFYSDGSYTELQ